MPETECTRRDAMALLLKYNTDPFHIYHALTVSCVMRWFAEELGYSEDKAFWSLAGLLHDVDFGSFPDQHCQKAPELLAEIDAEPPLVHAVCSHAYGICSDVEPTHEMEKVLFACDELTGLIGAAVKMRPSRSVLDMELKSVKKKFKDNHFAAGCSRDIMRRGAEMLGWELTDLFEKTLRAMKACEATVADEMEAWHVAYGR